MHYLGLARRMGILLRPFVFGIVLLSASSSLAIDRQQAEMSARESFAAGRYGEALAMFAKLYAETLHPVYLRNIGRCHQKMRDPDQAIDSFRDYLTKAKKIPAEERAEIEGYIKEMEALRTEQARAKEQSATPPVPMALGAAAPPAAVVPVAPPPASPGPAPAVSLVGSSTPEESPPIYTRWWFWTGVGAVVAGAVVAGLVLSGGRPDCTAPECK